MEKRSAGGLVVLLSAQRGRRIQAKASERGVIQAKRAPQLGVGRAEKNSGICL
ncbi:hypothetical protein METHB2_810008 [Candidatus Methylobacter favarea]|uniref:Uncharacterized protein n=1 Tax=Candidatus Methylobacter favarea TaxID=2707345 RepID=A0A8S0XLH5_9GAMM|nr:hypothetical protein METHB2_810008 [Candidatus Methylobacter favarea]